MSAESRRSYLAIIGTLRCKGAAGVILGCTEIPLQISPDDIDLPLFNSTALHAGLALEHCFQRD